MGDVSHSRGYSFENELVKKLRSYGWRAKRLGGSSTNFPDVVATNKKYSILLAAECKAWSTQKIEIPLDQFHRCFDVCDMFDLYEKRIALFAFKFNRIVCKRKVRIFYGVMGYEKYVDNEKKDVKVVCDYDTGIEPNYINNVTKDFFDIR